MPTGTIDSVGTVRRRKDANYIKVSDTGRHDLRWVQYSRWLWETHNGPVPDGMRVLHRDGNSHNDDLRNLVLGTASDVLWIHCHADPKKSKANYQACRKATAKANRRRGRENRQECFLAKYWYAVDSETHEVLNHPRRTVMDIARLLELEVSNNRLAWPHVLGDPHGSKASAIILRCLRPDRLLRAGDVYQSMQTWCNRYGLRAVGRSVFNSQACELRSRGLVEGPRGKYRRTLSTMTSLVVVRGAQLYRFAEVKRYRGRVDAFRELVRLEPSQQVKLTTGHCNRW